MFVVWTFQVSTIEIVLWKNIIVMLNNAILQWCVMECNGFEWGGMVCHGVELG